MAWRTTWLVAASMPAEPAANMKRTSPAGCSAMKRSTSPTTPSSVRALWSLRKTCRPTNEQALFSSSRGAMACTPPNALSLAMSSYHLKLPSLKPTIASFDRPAIDCVPSTPGSCCSRQPSSSTWLSVA